ncbi:MAG: MarR family transcriptional regulator [Pseudonocardia sp.]|uniref:MarR family winged helix-turn-helix transcriptional regulator n=1 Tax=unclassified Pseudonocardia TaxID=2619320 RepID=UPI000868945C|nr:MULTISPECIES: MarR family transcriptional regulator [unclassified Pseudonocardia]MBN9108151.1 MarR family transcriptional regulator [Pseudonocardia sp.]ODV06199.1 MAG: MarR family transcriptional regulator [Pseudonocardia sp. SCN 73-27]
MDHTRWLDEDEQKTWRAFLAATRLVFDRVERQMSQESGIPQTYYELLVRLSEAPDRTLRMSTLADTALSSRSRLSHAVARLEETGWVERSACLTDRRGSFARLTDEGMAALEAAAPGHVETVRTAVFDPLTREQQAALRDAAETIVAALADGAHPLGVGAPAAAPVAADENG